MESTTDFNEPNQAIAWSFDEKELQLIFEIKVVFVKNMFEWNLEEAYWSLLRLESEINAKFNIKSEIPEILNRLKILELKRDEYNKNNTIELRGEFYIQLDDVYKFLCRKMKEHGIYFRERKSPMSSVMED